MKSKKITVEDFYLESDNFEAWWIQRAKFFQIKTKSGHYVDCQISIEGVKKSFAYYEQRKSLAESAGDYIESDNFYAKISDTRIRHNIFRSDGKQVLISIYDEDLVEILNQCEAELLEEQQLTY